MMILAWYHYIPWLKRLQDDLLRRAGLLDETMLLGDRRQAEALRRTGQRALAWDSASAQGEEPALGSDRFVMLGIAETEMFHRTMGRRVSRDIVTAEAKICIRSVRRAIRESDLRGVIVWNGWLAVPRCVRAAFEEAGLPSVYAEIGLLPHSLMVDPVGLLAQSSLSALYWTNLVERGISDRDRTRTLDALTSIREGRETVWPYQGRRQVALRDRLQLAEGKPVVLVVGQVDHDSNIICNSPWFKTNGDVLRAVYPTVGQVELLFKPHPAIEASVPAEALRKEFPGLHVVSGSDLPSVLDISDAVVVRNSASGVEALARGMPVIALAKSIYSGRGTTVDIRLASQVPDAVLGVASAQAEGRFWSEKREALRLIFFNWLMFTYLYFESGHEPEEGVGQLAADRLRNWLGLKRRGQLPRNPNHPGNA